MSSKNYFDIFAGLSGTTAVISSLGILRHLRPCVPQVTSRIGKGQWRIQGRGRGGPPSPLFLDKTEAKGPKKKLKAGPPLSQGLDDTSLPSPPPLSEGLDPPPP